MDASSTTETQSPTQADLIARARELMVDGQVRPNRVVDPRIIRATRTLPRERFLPDALRDLAYADVNVPLGAGRVLLAPVVIARLAQVAAVAEGERVLVVAAGPGYGAALLVACGGVVTALEEDAALVARARAALGEFAPAVKIEQGKLSAGWPEAAPYDVILIEGAAPVIPAGLGGQLRPGGRLVGILAGRGHAGQAVIAEATSVGLHPQPVFDCAAPPIPALTPPPGFVF
jgi:protein-L-isoaspartate(D-aspartate) O-methyltransferase